MSYNDPCNKCNQVCFENERDIVKVIAELRGEIAILKAEIDEIKMIMKITPNQTRNSYRKTK